MAAGPTARPRLSISIFGKRQPLVSAAKDVRISSSAVMENAVAGLFNDTASSAERPSIKRTRMEF
jgi:hypothetical protein